LNTYKYFKPVVLPLCPNLDGRAKERRIVEGSRLQGEYAIEPLRLVVDSDATRRTEGADYRLAAVTDAGKGVQ
jgi:hypothetical protein